MRETEEHGKTLPDARQQGKQVAKSGQASGHFDINDLLSKVSSQWAS